MNESEKNYQTIWILVNDDDEPTFLRGKSCKLPFWFTDCPELSLRHSTNRRLGQQQRYRVLQALSNRLQAIDLRLVSNGGLPCGVKGQGSGTERLPGVRQIWICRWLTAYSRVLGFQPQIVSLITFQCSILSWRVPSDFTEVGSLRCCFFLQAFDEVDNIIAYSTDFSICRLIVLTQNGRQTSIGQTLYFGQKSTVFWGTTFEWSCYLA